MFIIAVLEAGHDETEAMVLEALLARIACGDKAALAELYDKTHAAVYGFAMSLSHCSDDAEDVLQETYISVFSAAERYKPHGKPMAWIMTIAKNYARMNHRRSSNLTELPDDDWSEYLAQNPMVSTDERLLLEAALRTLSPEQRQIVMLHAVAGLKHREIAALIEIPTATVLSKYSRALAKLRTAMEVN